MPSTTDDILRSIDGKLAAILTLTLDSFLRETEIARPKPRSVDKMLADAGLSAATIASLLGKTERAVHKQLANAAPKGKANGRANAEAED